jgi:hypothetical protein
MGVASRLDAIDWLAAALDPTNVAFAEAMAKVVRANCSDGGTLAILVRAIKVVGQEVSTNKIGIQKIVHVSPRTILFFFIFFLNEVLANLRRRYII